MEEKREVEECVERRKGVAGRSDRIGKWKMDEEREGKGKGGAKKGSMGEG